MTVASTRNNSVGFSFFLYLSLFLLVFDLSIPPIKSIGSAPLSIIISLLSLVMFNKGKSKEVLVDSFNIIGIYFLILVYVVIRLLASDTEEPSFLMSSLKSSVILIATLLFIYVFQSELTIKNVINIFFFNALFCLIAGVVPPLLDLAVLVKHGYHEVGFITYRSAFLSGSSAFGIAAPYTIFICIMGYYLSKSKISIIDFAKFGIIALSSILTARTSFLGLGVAILMIVIFRPSLIPFVLLVLVVGLYFILTNEYLSSFSSWIFELFINFLEGDAQTDSSNILQSMYFLPDGLTLLFGDARYTDGALYYMMTDAGYMRHLLFGGLPLVVLTLFIIVDRAIYSKSRYYSFIICPLVLILHVKGVVILNNPSVMPLIIITSFLFRWRKI